MYDVSLDSAWEVTTVCGLGDIQVGGDLSECSIPCFLELPVFERDEECVSLAIGHRNIDRRGSIGLVNFISIYRDLLRDIMRVAEDVIGILVESNSGRVEDVYGPAEDIVKVSVIRSKQFPRTVFPALSTRHVFR